MNQPQLKIESLILENLKTQFQNQKNFTYVKERIDKYHSFLSQEKTRDYNPNDFANIINKIRKFDYTATPANNNLPESLKQQYVPAEKEDNLLDMTQKLFQEYQGFIKNI